MENIKFFLNNVLKPFGKTTIRLGASTEGKRYLKYFNKRPFKRAFLKNKKYNCSIIELKEFQLPEDYLKTIKGKNSADYFSRRSMKLGLSFSEFNPNEKIEEIFTINTSSCQRQGRSMDENYSIKIESWPHDDSNRWFGVFNIENQLVAYLWSIEMFELNLVNRILGHSDYLKSNVMYLLLTEFICEQIKQKTNENSYIMYDTFGRSNNGLVLFKKRIGFKSYTVNFKQ